MSMLRRAPLALVCLALVACPEHAPAWYGFTGAELSGSTGSTGIPEPGGTTTTKPDDASTSMSGGSMTGEAGTGDSTAGEASTGGSVGELLLPELLEVEMPAKVNLAGPVAFTVTTRHAKTARANLDGAPLAPLQDEGGGVFSGVVPIFGAVDNGAHVLEVIAENGQLADLREVPFEVATPAPGSVQWAVLHPTGSATRRVAVTPEGDVIEVGHLDVAGVARPSIRKRSALNGTELWDEGTIVLDNRQGTAEDVAVPPDGRMWVAMNVREPSNKWRPRIVLLDALGHETGVEMPGEPGPTVRALDHDGTGGVFAAGYANTGYGDADIAVWRMTGDHVAVFSAKLWDYWPADKQEHSFTDLAFDVVVQDDVAWVVGSSHGKHEVDALDVRGIIVRMDVDNGMVLVSAIVQPTINAWRQSMFFGATGHPDGIAVAGNGMTADGTAQRIELSVFNAAGERKLHAPEPAAVVAQGNAVALNTHGVFVVAGWVKEGDVLRGVLLGRGTSTFDLKFPPHKESSAALGVALDPFDQAFVGGYMTYGGTAQARVARVAQ